MEYRASIPVTLPRAEPTVSYWQDPPASISHHRSTQDLPESASIVVIGSGITGATLSHHLLTQNDDKPIVMLEARTACSGATGRNGGHTKCASYRSFLDNVKAFGEAEAVKIVRYEYKCMKSVHAFARQHNIDCDSWEGDTVDIFHDEKQWLLAHEAVEAIQRVLGSEDPAAKYQFWNAEDTAARFLSPGAFGALTCEAGSLSAYKFTIGMLDICLKKGLNLQTNTSVIKLKPTESGWTVETTRGSISATRVVLATNGYTAALHPEFQGSIVPLRGHVTSHRPGTSMPLGGLMTTYSYIYSNGYEYMIPRPQGTVFAGDIVIGGGRAQAVNQGLDEFGTTDDTTWDDSIMEYLQGSTKAYFGSNWGEDHPDGRIRRAWTGIMGYSPDGLPFVGSVPGQSGLTIAASFQGHGMVLAFLAAKALATIMNNDKRNSDNEKEQIDWFPKSFLVTQDRMRKTFQQSPT